MSSARIRSTLGIENFRDGKVRFGIHLIALFIPLSCSNSTSPGDVGSGGTDSGSGGTNSGGADGGGASSGGLSGSTGGAPSGTGASSAGGTESTGGSSIGGTDAGGANGGGGAQGGSGGTESDDCEEIACPDVGHCEIQRSGDQCVRVCTIDVDGSEPSTYFARTMERVEGLGELNCQVLDGSLEIEGDAIESLTSLHALREVTGTLLVRFSPLPSLSGLEGLERVRTLLFEGDNNVTDVSFPKLVTVEDWLGIYQMGGAETFHFAALESAGLLEMNGNAAVVEINLDSLEVAESISIGANSSLLTVNGLPSLEEVTQNFNIVGNPHLPECEIEEVAARIPCDICESNDDLAVCN